MNISRRTFLAGLLATAACSSSDGGGGDDPVAASSSAPPSLPTVTPVEPAPSDLASDPFTLGVASGDPDDRSVVLWTRLVPDAGGMPDDDVEVAWDVAEDEAFTRIVATGLAPGVATLAHSVHAVTTDLPAGRTWWYRFRAGGFTSAVGRTRTAPAVDAEVPVRLAVAACQRYTDGFYAAHRDIADADVDLVVFVGDYVYEAGRGGVRTMPGGGEDASDLAGYRTLYTATHRDPDLARCHARHPWVAVWDDHEVNDNYNSGESSARRAAAYQAWYEHMPVRLAPPESGTWDIHRAVRWGSTLELLLLDTRQHRSAQGCSGGLGDSTCPDLADASRTMLGEAQEAWLAERFAAATTAWTAVAQQVVFAPMEAVGRVNLDAWDGYPQARERVVAALAASNVRNAVFLTGDIHAELVADVPQGTQTVATELVTSSISSQFQSEIGDAFDLLPFAAINARHAHSGHRGWLRCDLEPARWTARYRRVADVADPASPVEDGPAFEVLDGQPGAGEL